MNTSPMNVSSLLAGDPLTAGIAAEIREVSDQLILTPDRTRLYIAHLDECPVCAMRGYPCGRALRLILPGQAVDKLLRQIGAAHKIDVVLETMRRKSTAELLSIDAEGLDGRWHQAARAALEERINGKTRPV